MSSHVVVVVPARNEAGHIDTTLRSVQRSVTRARHAGLLDRSTIEVRAHLCTDPTVAVARQTLAPGEGRVVEDHTSRSVGQVRDGGVRAGLQRLGSPLSATWVLSTDADTCVPDTWVAHLLTAARGSGSVGVAGLAQLDRSLDDPIAAMLYQRLLDMKMRHGEEHHHHDHVYGANLAVRADAYLDVGGFPDVAVGEDAALVDALEEAGLPVLRTRDIEVTTSARTHGRAAGGLAHLLAGLERASGAGSPLAASAPGSLSH